MESLLGQPAPFPAGEAPKEKGRDGAPFSAAPVLALLLAPKSPSPFANQGGRRGAAAPQPSALQPKDSLQLQAGLTLFLPTDRARFGAGLGPNSAVRPHRSASLYSTCYGGMSGPKFPVSSCYEGLFRTHLKRGLLPQGGIVRVVGLQPWHRGDTPLRGSINWRLKEAA